MSTRDSDQASDQQSERDPFFKLNEDETSFIQGPVSIVVSSCSRDLVPNIVRALGCRVDDGGRVTLLVDVNQARAVIADLEAGSMVAAVFSRPTTHRTIQLKGLDPRVLAAAAGDWDRVLAYRRAMVAELRVPGYGEMFVSQVLAADADSLGAVSFTPSEGFAQTPGPGAGGALRP